MTNKSRRRNTKQQLKHWMKKKDPNLTSFIITDFRFFNVDFDDAEIDFIPRVYFGLVHYL